jgi:hypothetical protein
VWVAGEIVAKKDANGFPPDEDVLVAVQQAMGRV